MEWYALYTKPRWEKKVAKALEKIGIIVYCPMITEVRQWSDRKKKVTLPLFKSYVLEVKPDGSTATSSPTRYIPLATLPAYPR